MTTKKRVLITGASTGFGYGTAKALAERGHTVFATMRGVSGKNAEVAGELEAWANSGGHALTVLELDVTDDKSVEDAVREATTGGGVDVLINNAGVGNFGIDESFSVEQAQALFNVNVFGVIRLNRALVPHMRKAQSGRILYVSSGLGRVILPFLAIYNASKFALEGYAESAHYELSHLGIHTTIVEPGAYGTGFISNTLAPARDLTSDYGHVGEMFKGFAGAFEERAKKGEMGDPIEVVNALVEETEAEGARPLRRPVGGDMMQPVTAVNETCHAVQEQTFRAMGMG